LFLFQQYLIKDRDRKLCFRGFLNNNLVGLLLFVALFIDYLQVPVA